MKGKINDDLSWHRKSIWSNSLPPYFDKKKNALPSRYQVGVDGSHLHVIKPHMDNPSSVRLSFSSKIRNERGRPPSPLPSSLVQEAPGRAAGGEESLKGIQTEKEELKWSLLAGDVILCRKSQRFHKNLLKLIIKFSQRRIQSQHTRISYISIDTEEEITKNVPLPVASKRIKHLGINQGAERLVQWKYRRLLPEITIDKSKWKHIPCSWMGHPTVPCQWHPTWCADWLQCLSTSQWHFAEKEKPILRMES